MTSDLRPTVDEWFTEFALVTAKRSNCSRRKVGAVAAIGKHLISHGYNGTPEGVDNCFDGGCPRCASDAPSGHGLDICLCIHAEQNVINQAAIYGAGLVGARLYVTHRPCIGCLKLIAQVGIKWVGYLEPYYDESLATETAEWLIVKGTGLRIERLTIAHA